MIPIVDTNTFLNTILKQNKGYEQNESVINTAKQVIRDIRTNGDTALIKYVEKFDKFVPKQWEVSSQERENAWSNVSKETVKSLEKAAVNIRSFHKKQLPTSRFMDLNGDIISGQLYRPIERVGIYVPGGTASYPSSVLMNAIPAVLAGVEEVIMVTPARDGELINPVLTVAADIAGVNKIYKLGGIQAIAALAYGTESIPSVDKIVGPGNAYVAAAKSLVFGDVGIDMIAGPSEVAIIADETAEPAFVAADLIAQAEHDTNARTFLFTTSEQLITEVNVELSEQLYALPRKDIAEVSLRTQSAIVQVNDINEAFTLINKLAPEHLEVQVKDPLSYLGKVKNAGSVFLGNYTPEALGDYFAGPNHVLPTSGTARFSSGLSVDDFIKKSTFIYYTEDSLKEAKQDIVNIATEEKLVGHARAVEKRFSTK